MINQYRITQDDFKAIQYFEEKFPDWWYKIGICHTSRDFDCAPTQHSEYVNFIDDKTWTDDCFTLDHAGTLSECIHSVIVAIQHAIDDCKDGAPDGMIYDVRQGIFVKIEDKP